MNNDQSPSQPVVSDNIVTPEIKPQSYCLCKCHIQGGNIDKIKHTDTCVHCVKEEVPAIVGEVVPENREEKQVGIRDAQGKFVPGVSGNPAGRPKREWTWSTLIEDYADRSQRLKNGEKYTWRELVVKRLYTEASNGNIHAIREIMDRMDGKPVQESVISTDKDYQISVKRS